jgi:hypothetical protein
VGDQGSTLRVSNAPRGQAAEAGQQEASLQTAGALRGGCMSRGWVAKAAQQEARRQPAGTNKRQMGGRRWRWCIERQGHAKRMSSRGSAMRGSTTISWQVESWWPDGVTVLALRIIPYPKAGGASCTELLEYVSHRIWQKTCMEVMLVEAIWCPPLPLPVHVA